MFNPAKELIARIKKIEEEKRNEAEQHVPDGCFIRLFKKYRSLCPPNAHLLPPTPPLPHPGLLVFLSTCGPPHPLSNTVARLCKSAGIEGYKTNHSLRATSTSRLCQSGVDEQLVMDIVVSRALKGRRTSRDAPCPTSLTESGRLPRSTSLLRTPPEIPPPHRQPLPDHPRQPIDQHINCTFNLAK